MRCFEREYVDYVFWNISSNKGNCKFQRVDSTPKVFCIVRCWHDALRECDVDQQFLVVSYSVFSVRHVGILEA